MRILFCFVKGFIGILKAVKTPEGYSDQKPVENNETLQISRHIHFDDVDRCHATVTSLQAHHNFVICLSPSQATR